MKKWNARSTGTCASAARYAQPKYAIDGYAPKSTSKNSTRAAARIVEVLEHTAEADDARAHRGRAARGS
jgi:hypothetical protein